MREDLSTVNIAILDDLNITTKETEKLSNYKTWRCRSAGCEN